MVTDHARFTGKVEVDHEEPPDLGLVIQRAQAIATVVGETLDEFNLTICIRKIE